jgi:hypothetical protein
VWDSAKLRSVEEPVNVHDWYVLCGLMFVNERCGTVPNLDRLRIPLMCMTGMYFVALTLASHLQSTIHVLCVFNRSQSTPFTTGIMLFFHNI